MTLLEKGRQVHVDFIKSALRLISRHKVAFLLLIAILLSLHTHWMVLREWHMPTYGNTMIHVASARHVIETGDYPLIDYSYGGGIPNLYVPAYRILVAVFVLLTGLTLDEASRLLVLIFSVMVPIGFFILGRKMFGTNVGLLAAFACVLPGEFLIYTVRPLPQAMGLALLPIAFHAFYTRNLRVALLTALAITLIHQEAAAFLVGGLCVYFGFVILHMIWRVLISKEFNMEKHSHLLKHLLAGIAFSLFVYLAWQSLIVGHINFFELAQFKNHEGNVVSMDSYLLKTGSLVSTFCLAGLFLCVAYFVKYLLKEFSAIPDDVRPGLRSFFTFLFAAFGSYLVLNNFSISRNLSQVSISFPVYLGPLAGMEIALISLVVALFGVFVLKILDHSEEFSKHDKLAYLFLFALFVAGFVAVKNDAIPFIAPRVFMDRFLVYLQIPLVLLASLGAYSLFEFALQLPKRHLPA
ncbi:MAG: hypothetical protein ABH863_02520 [Candidatus Micrarchaeota archaeon]